MAAAVADFRPGKLETKKIKKDGSNVPAVELVQTRDILSELGHKKKAGQLVIGFALETDHEIANAKKKLNNKKADVIVLNSLSEKGSGFGHDTNKITLITDSGKPQSWPLMSKAEAASVIINELETQINRKK